MNLPFLFHLRKQVIFKTLIIDFQISTKIFAYLEIDNSLTLMY